MIKGRRIRVLHLMGSLQPSGMERMFMSGAKYFKDLGAEFIIVGQGNDHPYAPELAKAGYRVEQVPPLRTIRGFLAFRKLVSSLVPDIVHIHTEGAFASSVLAAHGVTYRRPIVRTVHNVFQGNPRGRVSRKLQARLVDRFVSSFIVPSPDVGDNESAFGRGCKLIYNWVDDSYFKLQQQRATLTNVNDRPSIIMVGNASRIKNQELVLKILQKLPLDLYFHGDEANATETERRLLDKLESHGRLLHRGVGDPGPSLLKATLFAMPSKHEGMPVSLAEALTVGLPALVNDVPGLRWAADVSTVEVVRDEPEAWQTAFERILSVGHRPHQQPEEAPNFSARRGALEYVSLYRELLHHRTNRHNPLSTNDL